MSERAALLPDFDRLQDLDAPAPRGLARSAPTGQPRPDPSLRAGCAPLGFRLAPAANRPARPSTGGSLSRVGAVTGKRAGQLRLGCPSRSLARYGSRRAGAVPCHELQDRRSGPGPGGIAAAVRGWGSGLADKALVAVAGGWMFIGAGAVVGFVAFADLGQRFCDQIPATPMLRKEGPRCLF